MRFLFCLLAFSSLNATEIELLLPVNAASRPRVNLQVQIPSGFKSIQTLKEFESPTQTLLEFIPENEDPDNWTEIITVFKYIANQVSAPELVGRIKKSLIEKNYAKVLTESNKDFKNYKHATLAVDYIFQNHMEVLGMIYDSGPYDCSGVQYTIRPSREQTSAEVLKKINNFFKSNTQIIEF